MSNPKRAKETISLIEDFTRAPGVVEKLRMRFGPQ